MNIVSLDNMKVRFKLKFLDEKKKKKRERLLVPIASCSHMRRQGKLEVLSIKEYWSIL